MTNTLPAHTNTTDITTERVVQIAQEAGIMLLPATIENSIDTIRSHVEGIVPPAKNPDEQANDIRTALNKIFSDFNFGETTPREMPKTTALPKFNQLVRTFEKKGMNHAEAIEQAADAIEILKRIEADQPIFDTPLRQIQNAFTNVDMNAVSGVGV